MLHEVRVIIAHGNHNSRINGQSIPWIGVLDVRTGYSRRGKGSVDCWQYPAWDCRLGFSRSVPVLVIHAGAVSVLDVYEP